MFTEVLTFQRPEVYLKDNVARIRDIELLTGLRFMTSYEASTGARFRTYLPEELWASEVIQPASWHDLPCPHKDLCQSEYGLSVFYESRIVPQITAPIFS